MTTPAPLARTPYYFLAGRRYRETELAAYLRREHRRGRRLSEIVNDPCITHYGGKSVLRAALRRPSLIRALGEDVADAITQSTPEAQR